MRWHQPLFAAALLVALAACADDDLPTSANPRVPESPRVSMDPTTARVVAYFPTWDGNVNNIPYSKLTHIIYAFALPTGSGGLTNIPMSGDTRLSSLVSQAHAAGVKVLISVGGWNNTNDSIFGQMSSSSTTRTAFVNNVSTFISNYGLDGVDIDWEYPNTSTESANFAALMSELGTAMHSNGKLLTAAVAATGSSADGILTEVFDDVDFLILMAYARSTVPHSPYSYAVEALDYWANRGLPQSKRVLGVPFYGKNASGANQPYRWLVKNYAYAPNTDSAGGYWYNGIATMKQKTTLSLQRGSGVGIWELSNDTTLSSISLLQAVQDAMNSPVPPYDYTKVVYDEALNGWADWSWSTTRNFASTAQAHAGTKSIAVTYTAAWGGLYLHYGAGVNPYGLSKLEFWIHGGSSGGQQMVVKLGEPGTSTHWLPAVSLNTYNACGAVTANTWCKVSIPLSALGVTTALITELEVQDNSGAAQPTYYLDDVRFIP
ncbi:MAG TPA: glycoside hydrolase family 18 protein [Pseudonocardiaceae bacterium]|nr:glycoside hydrolase family 18 protein [Pseudonocardiaceae bacterium]